jgi:SOS-response transcriptional repressor LexA
MTGAGILNGDVLVVDRAREPRHGQFVVAVIDNGWWWLVRRPYALIDA